MEIKQPLKEPKEKITQKPLGIEDYKKWLYDQLDIELSHNAETYYNEVTSDMVQQSNDSPFWIQLKENLAKYDQEYQRDQDCFLLAQSEKKIGIIGKPFDSFLWKTYGKNVLENRNWPEKPEGGWILPEDWFTAIHDLARTRFVTKHIDGVKFLAGKIKSLCAQYCMVPCTVDFEGRDEGYYAAHISIEKRFNIPTQGLERKEICSCIEIQVTTELQEAIRSILHKDYIEMRKLPIEERRDIKWEYESDEFFRSYLGHVLHYIEGMIVVARKKQRRKIL